MSMRDIHIPARAELVMRALEDAGHEAFMVGGAVRDMLLGRPVDDVDITSSASPDDAARILSDAGAHVIPTGISHGTITAVVDGEPFEVTTFRVDGSYSDGRHPDSVQPAQSIEEDLARRDFTVNAMAYNGARGLVDPFGGHGDLERGLIRCVGDPATRFSEDALRILRAIRFSAQLGFDIEEGTAQAIHEHRGRLSAISRERIGVEFAKTVCAPGGATALGPYGDVVATILPETGNRDIDGNLRVLREVDGGGLPLRLAALLDGIDGLQEALSSLRLPKRTTGECLSIVEAASADLPGTPYEGKLLLGRYGTEILGDALTLQRARARAAGQPTDGVDDAQTLIDGLVGSGACCTVGELAVDGEDVKATWGVDGAEVGRVLHELLDLVMRDELPNERDALLASRPGFTTSL